MSNRLPRSGRSHCDVTQSFLDTLKVQCCFNEGAEVSTLTIHSVAPVRWWHQQETSAVSGQEPFGGIVFVTHKYIDKYWRLWWAAPAARVIRASSFCLFGGKYNLQTEQRGHETPATDGYLNNHQFWDKFTKIFHNIKMKQTKHEMFLIFT